MSDAPASDPLVLWEGEGALAVQKRSGELVHNSHFAGPKELSLKQRLGRTQGRRVYPVHRLDRGTSGIVLFARERTDVGPWQAAVAQGEKDYFAIVRGHLEERHLVERAVRDENGVERTARTAVVPLAVSSVERVSLVGLRLFTGRHHQARRHCVHLRHPVVGDSTHGDTRFNRAFRDATGLRRLGLHAYRLAFETPDSSHPVEILSSPVDALLEAVNSLFDVELAIAMASLAEAASEFEAAAEMGASPAETKNSLAGS